MQLIWAEDHERSLRAFAVVILTVLLLAIFFLTPEGVSNGLAITGGLVASIIALWSWWIANAKQKDLLDLDAPTGGKAIGGELAGNLDDFTV